MPLMRAQSFSQTWAPPTFPQCYFHRLSFILNFQSERYVQCLTFLLSQLENWRVQVRGGRKVKLLFMITKPLKTYNQYHSIFTVQVGIMEGTPVKKEQPQKVKLINPTAKQLKKITSGQEKKENSKAKTIRSSVNKSHGLRPRWNLTLQSPCHPHKKIKNDDDSMFDPRSHSERARNKPRHQHLTFVFLRWVQYVMLTLESQGPLLSPLMFTNRQARNLHQSLIQ